jgi:hypothetical protein
MHPTVYRLLLWGAWCVCGVQAARFILLAIDTAPQETQGFIGVYTSARLLREGAEVQQFYSDWFPQQMAHMGFTVREVFGGNPPTAALIGLPFSPLSYIDARVGWSVLSLLVLAAALMALVRLTGLRGIWVPTFLAGVLSFQPLHANIRFANMYVVLLGLLTLAWWGYRQGRQWAIGPALGLMMIFKVSGGGILLLLLVQRQGKALLLIAGTAVATVLVSLPLLGIESWRTYLSLLSKLVSDPSIAVAARQSMSGFFRHLFTFDAFWNPAPWFVAPVLAEVLFGLSLVAALLPAAWLAARHGPSDLLFAAFTVISIILVPTALDYHYTLMILPLALVWATLQQRPRVLPLAVFAAAAFAMGADLPYQSPRLSEGLWALLAYPKLYGAWLLWGLATYLAYQSLRISTTDEPIEPLRRAALPAQPQSELAGVSG